MCYKPSDLSYHTIFSSTVFKYKAKYSSFSSATGYSSCHNCIHINELIKLVLELDYREFESICVNQGNVRVS